VYLYVSPAVAGLLVLVFVPFITGVGLSFYRYHLEGNAYAFIGFGNFAEILAPDELADIHFWRTLGVTLLWTTSNVFLHVAIGLGLALVLNRPDLRGRRFYRVLLVLPWAVPSYITALLWRAMFLGKTGPVNTVLDAAGFGAVHWFDDTFWANFIPNLVTNTWLGFPFMMVVAMGALQSIPKSLYEAASLDGASGWQRFRHVTLPLLKPALLPAVIMGTIWTFNMFNVIYLVSMGNGGTEILITEAYRAFNEQHRHGYAAAYSVMIFGILLGYTVVTTRVTRAAEGAMA
jgi:arabinogalactan oligomer/maltooligosaccharide transport system permease protein